MNNLFDTIADIAFTPYSKMFELSRLHLETPVFSGENEIRVLEPGMQVCIQSGMFLVNGKPTHEVKTIRGTLANTKFDFSAIDLKTGELINVNL